jgi:hypothetical protein
MLEPRNFNEFSISERIEWYNKSPKERYESSVASHLQDFVNENNEIDIRKLVERILYLEERVEELEITCERVNND